MTPNPYANLLRFLQGARYPGLSMNMGEGEPPSPIFSAEATATAPPEAAPESIAGLLGGMPQVPYMRSQVSGTPQLPQPMHGLELANMIGRAAVPTPQTDYYFPQQSPFGQQHPMLSRMLEAGLRTGAGFDPTGPGGLEYKFRAARQAGLEALPAARLQAGLGTVSVLDKMRQAQTKEEQDARRLESLLTLQRAQTAAAQAREGFTLGPGQVRFGPNGEMIAEGTAQQAAQQGAFTLGPGQIRFGPQGEQIAEGLPSVPSQTAPTTRVMGNRTFQWDATTGTWKDVGPKPATGAGASAVAKADAEQKISSIESDLDRLGGIATELLTHGGMPGAVGARFPFQRDIPGTAARDFMAKLEALKAQVGFNALQKMRDLSRTGGAVGQVSNYEQELFQQQIDSLDPNQSEAQFKASLGKVIAFVRDSKARLRGALNQPSPSIGPNLSDVSTEELWQRLQGGQ